MPCGPRWPRTSSLENSVQRQSYRLVFKLAAVRYEMRPSNPEERAHARMTDVDVRP